MIIGTVRETKAHEYRVGITPPYAKSLVSRGHTVLLEKGAGLSAGFPDPAYESAGARIVNERDVIYADAEMIIKVKEPQPDEIPLLRENQILFTYLHLAASEKLTRELMRSGIKGVAYETIETDDGALPCLKPMSEIAGRLSVQEGAKYLEKTFGGRGVLLGGVPGVPRGKVGIIGGGVVGTNACKVAVGMGAEVTILDISSNRLAYLDDIFSTHITTLYSTDANIETVLGQSDLVIGAVLVPGGKTPWLIRKEHLKAMKNGAVIVDVAIDQGGCVETSHPTTHDDPVFVIDGVVHYCVANMPGAVALSSTLALTSTTLPYALLIAENGLEEAALKSPDLYRGVNVYGGECVYANVADVFGIKAGNLRELLS